MHDDQLLVTVEVVRDLVAEQFPEWRELSIEAVTSPGTVNAIFRIGDRLAARLPLRVGEVDETRRLLEAGVAAARELLGQIPFATPEPIALGEPAVDYPLPWSIQTWLPGVTGAADDPGDSFAFAHDLARLVRSLWTIDPRGRTFRDGNRGGDLRRHDPWMEVCFEHSGELLDVERLRSMWTELRELPRIKRDVMSHGDLIPGNVLIGDDRLVGVLDVGGFGPADPSLDLVGACIYSRPARGRSSETISGATIWSGNGVGPGLSSRPWVWCGTTRPRTRR